MATICYCVLNYLVAWKGRWLGSWLGGWMGGWTIIWMDGKMNNFDGWMSG